MNSSWLGGVKVIYNWQNRGKKTELAGQTNPSGKFMLVWPLTDTEEQLFPWTQ